MQYTSHYCSPIGDILLAADDIGLTGLWFEGQKYFALYLDKEHEEKEVPLFEKAKQWLDIYFSGKEPDFTVPLHFTGTDFQNAVWEILCTIPDYDIRRNCKADRREERIAPYVSAGRRRRGGPQ